MLELWGEVIALKIVTACLLKMVRSALPDEADPKAVDATLSMCLNSVRAYPMGDLPPEQAELVRGRAEIALMAIFSAPNLPMPPEQR